MSDVATQEPSLRTAVLGHPFTDAQLQDQCKVVFGGVAWPGKRPGFAVVLAMDPERHFNSHDIYLLDEVESADMRVLVRQCGVLDTKYKPSQWLGDNRNSAADRFIQEVNEERPRLRGPFEERRDFHVCPTSHLDMEGPYEYLLPTIKALLAQDRRQLFLKTSRVLEYLGQIKPDEIPFMEFGEYPAIEALGFAVCEMLDYAQLVDSRLRTSREDRLRLHPMAL